MYYKYKYKVEYSRNFGGDIHFETIMNILGYKYEITEEKPTCCGPGDCPEVVTYIYFNGSKEELRDIIYKKERLGDLLITSFCITDCVEINKNIL